MGRSKKPAVAKVKIKRGDTVKVIAGSSKGTVGEVLQVFPEVSKVLVEGVNIRTKHQKGTDNEAGGRVDKTMPVHISNVALFDASTNQTSRVGRRIEDGKLVRYAKRSGKTLS